VRADDPGETSAVLDEAYLVNRGTDDAPASRALTLQQRLLVGGVAVEQIGRVVRAYGTTVHVSGIDARIGQRCTIDTPGSTGHRFADVVGIADGQLILYPLGPLEGISTRSEVRLLQRGRSVRFSPNLVGSILDGTGRPLYAPGKPVDVIDLPVDRAAPDPLTRRPVSQVFATGVRAIDALLTIGEGQRCGIFAAAGGGKSTLLSMLARNADADVIVIGLIGERGREVREFIEHNLGEEGMRKAVLVVSTSDRPAMERVMAAQCATTIAEGFRARGLRVMLLIDSITRYARALREIGLSVGEPPVRRGFPPSVFAELPRLLERAGNDRSGSITAFYTVLVEDEETSDPIAEEVRSILDGHLVLSRELGEKGHYPPIDVLASASRLFGALTEPSHQAAALRVRELMAKYRELELLIQMGEYRPGADALADTAIERRDAIDAFLRQMPNEVDGPARSIEWLAALAADRVPGAS